jgi:molybdopterin-binding protein
MVAVITTESAKKLGLENGKDAYAIIKASSIMVGTD